MINAGTRVVGGLGSPTTRIAIAIIAAVGLALVVAGCGSTGGQVAHLGSQQNPSNHSAGSAQGRGAVAFSDCMRSHGVAAYPDPSSGGLLPKKTPQQLGVSSSQFQAAQSACQHLLPSGGGGPTPTQVAQYRTVMLKYARCMRSRGVPNFPDPDSRGHLDVGPGTDVPVNTPQFQSAFQVCKRSLSYYQSP